MTSKATKRKYVTQEVENEYILPHGDQMIVKVGVSRGNNLHQVTKLKLHTTHMHTTSAVSINALMLVK